jgi:ElaB/YqjD/DUF883 family membrane-anchored ribosome-binding protein
MTTPSAHKGNDADAEVTQRLAAAAHQTVDVVADAAADVEHDVRRRVATVGKRAAANKKRARAALNEGERKARSYLRREPWIGASIAVIAGFVLSALLRR